MIKYVRHFPLAVWALVCLSLGGVLAYAQWESGPAQLKPPTTSKPVDDRMNAMSLIHHLSTVHAAAAPPASGLAEWGAETAALADALAAQRGGKEEDPVALAYRDISTAANALTSVDPSNREQILSSIAAIGAAGNRLGAAVNGLSFDRLDSGPGM